MKKKIENIITRNVICGDVDKQTMTNELLALFDISKREQSFEEYKYHELSARATLYPFKTYEEVVEIIEKRRADWIK